jgi:hypothetical protein
MSAESYRPSYRAQLVKKYGGRVPTTSEGLPTGYYRTDMLPAYPSAPAQNIGSLPPSPGAELRREDDQFLATAKAMSSPQVAGGLAVQDQGADLADVLRAAFVELNFDHGYPGIPNGMPFWHKLEFESGFAFACFQLYLESGQDGPRELFSVASNEELLRVASAQHQRQLGPQELLFALQEYFTLNYWSSRAKAFDLYKESAWRHQRLKRQVRTENSHFEIAEQLMAKLAVYFGSERFMNEMTPKAAIDALGKIVAIQRISLGLPASGPLAANQQPEATSFEMIMRNVATTQGAGQASGQRGVAEHTKDMLDQVLADPTAANNLQEVIIRVTSLTAQANKEPERRFPGRDRGGIVFEEAEFIDVSTSNVPR